MPRKTRRQLTGKVPAWTEVAEIKRWRKLESELHAEWRAEHGDVHSGKAAGAHRSAQKLTGRGKTRRAQRSARHRPPFTPAPNRAVGEGMA